MSRVGKKPIIVPDKVQVTLLGNTIKAKGPKGEKQITISPEIEIKFENKVITFLGLINNISIKIFINEKFEILTAYPTLRDN